MKKLIYIAIFLIAFTISLLGQTYLNVDLSNFNRQPGFEKLTHKTVTYYIKKDIYYFDIILIFPSNKIIIFKCKEGSAMKWQDIYTDIVKLMGTIEYKNKDYIPNYAIDDIEYQSTLIHFGEAKYLRGWKHNKISIILSYTESGIMLSSAFLGKRINDNLNKTRMSTLNKKIKNIKEN